jgi:hypothetical protein
MISICGGESIHAGYAPSHAPHSHYVGACWKLFSFAIFILCIPLVAVATTATTLTLSTSSSSVSYGTAVTFTAVISPTAATGTVTFKNGTTTLGTGTLSSGIATYTTSALAVGSNTITASYPGNTTYGASTSNGLTETVTQATPTLSLTTSGTPSTYGGSVTFTATISNSLTGTVTFYNNGTSIGTGTISSSRATFSTSTLPAGSNTITAGWAGNTDYTAVTSSAITQTVNQATPTLSVATSGTPSTYGGSVTFTATISNSLTGTVTFYNNGTSIGTGTISSSRATFATSTLPAGANTITAGWAGNADYTAVTSSAITQTVNKATQTISFTAPSSPVTYGVLPIALSATGGGSGNPVIFSVVSGSGSISGSTLTVTGVGTVVVAANQASSANYAAAAQVEKSVVVDKALLTVKANNASRVYGAANPTFTPTYTGFVNGDTSAVLTGAPSLTTTATATSSPGNYTITSAVGSLAATNYSFTFVNGTLTITKEPLTLTWATPAAITYGTALSSTQLDASSGGVAGTFVYTPAAGTVLGAGSQTLSVTFTPTNTTDYSTQTTTVSLTVIQATLTVTANNVSKVYGAANPTFTPGYVGFVNGDTTSVLTGAPILTNMATAASPVGSYPITAALGTLSATKYSFVFESGTLTVANSIVNNICTGSAPFTPTGLAYDGTHLWVACSYLNYPTSAQAEVQEFSSGGGTPMTTISIPITVQSEGISLMYDGANIWVLDSELAVLGVQKGPSTLTRVQAATGQILGSPISISSYAGPGIAFDGTNVWVPVQASGSDAVAKVVAATGAVTTYPLSNCNGPSGMAFDGRHLWVSCNTYNNVVEFNPTSGTTLASVLVGGYPAGLAFDGTNIWVANGAISEEGLGSVSQINVNTLNSTYYPTGGCGSNSVAFDGAYVWVSGLATSGGVCTGIGGGLFSQLTSNGSLVATFPGSSGGVFAFDGGNVWASYAGPVAALAPGGISAQTLPQVGTVMEIKSSPNPSAYGAPVTLSALVDTGGKMPSGDVSFLDGSNEIGIANITATSTTNLLPYSQQFTNAPWSGYCGTTSNVTPNAAAGPDGSVTATKFVMPATFTCGSGVSSGIIDSIAGGLIAGNTYTVSVWLRGAIGGESVGFGLNDGYMSWATLSASWRRYAVTFPAYETNGEESRGFQVYSNSPNATYYMWGAQTELSASVGPYVVTGTTSATGTGGVATFSTTIPLAVGSHSISAIYGGISSPTLTQTVSGSIAIATQSLPDGTNSTPYTATLQATGGQPPYSWSLLNGSLPSPLLLSPTGGITGTPTAIGTGIFTVQVIDAASNTADATFSITVNPNGPPPQITGLSPTSGAPGSIVMIDGSNFGTTQEDSTVVLNNAPVTVLQWSDTSILFVVPSGASAGTVPVTVTVGGSSSMEFTVSGVGCS